MLSAFRGNFCGMPATLDEIGPAGTECTRLTRVSMLPSADAHPLAIPSAKGTNAQGKGHNDAGGVDRHSRHDCTDVFA